MKKVTERIIPRLIPVRELNDVISVVYSVSRLSGKLVGNLEQLRSKISVIVIRGDRNRDDFCFFIDISLGDIGKRV